MEQDFINLFINQQAKRQVVRNESANKRISKLKLLRDTIKKNESKIYLALQKDLQKSTFEAAITEVLFVYGEIDYAIKNLRRWMRPFKPGRSLSSFFAKNRIYYEPKGVCLVIAPWNYPFQLTMSPLVSAIAAGNCVIVKPSEISVATSDLVAELIAETFSPSEIACLQGDAQLSKSLLALPFDHVFFTGSTAIGKVVMEAAAKNLTSVTLELGGKSPTIIDQSANLAQAAEKIAWGKLTNCGQTCIAPDHVYVHVNQVDEFIGHYKSAATKMYFKTENKIDHATYGKIINRHHYQRLRDLVEDAVDQGARISWGGRFEEPQLVISPILLTQVPTSAKIMDEEIFGPILPVISYKDITEVIEQINRKSKPLALYIFGKSKTNIDFILGHTNSGGTCVNDVLVHISSPKIPFGGVNGSGVGSSHGFFGFKSFSHERAVVFQSKLNLNHLIYPPYLGKEWVLNLLRKIM